MNIEDEAEMVNCIFCGEEYDYDEGVECLDCGRFGCPCCVRASVCDPCDEKQGAAQ